MDADSIELMQETVAMARDSLKEALPVDSDASDSGSLFEGDDAGEELHQVSVGAFETLKMTAGFTESALVSTWCDDLADDFFSFQHDATEYITTEQGRAFIGSLSALEECLGEDKSNDIIAQLLAPLHADKHQKYYDLLNAQGDLEEHDPETVQAVSVEPDVEVNTEEEPARDIGAVEQVVLSEQEEPHAAETSVEISPPEELEQSGQDVDQGSEVVESAEDGSVETSEEEPETEMNEALSSISQAAESPLSEESSEDDASNFQQEPEFVPAAERVYSSAIEQEVVEILLEELSELEEDLEESEIVMFDFSVPTDIRQRAVEDYAGQLSKMAEAYETMGCRGLADATSFVGANASAIGSVENEKTLGTAKDTFAHWPKLFSRYLASQSRDQDALEILVLFQSPGWPSPITEEGSDALYLALIEEFNFASTRDNAEPRLETASDEDVDLTMDPEVSTNVVQSFLQEAPELGAQFTHTMVNLPDSKDLAEDLKSGQRTIHTIKGLATLVGVSGITNYSHNIEDILEYLMSTKIAPPAALTETLAESADTLESMLDYLAGSGTFPDDSKRVLNDILLWANRCDEDQIENYLEEEVVPDMVLPAEEPAERIAEDESAERIEQNVDQPEDEPEGSIEQDVELPEEKSAEPIELDVELPEDAPTEVSAEQVEHVQLAEEPSESPAVVESVTPVPLDSSISSHPVVHDEIPLAQHREEVPATALNTIPAVPILKRATTTETAALEQKENNTEGMNLTVPVSTVDQLFRAVGEMSVLVGQMQVQVNRVIDQSSDIRKQHRVIGQRQFELENVIDVQSAQVAKGRSDLIARQGNSELDSLELDQYGELHTSSHAYIETVADMQSMVRDVESESTALRNLVNTQSQLNKLLEELVTSTRLVSSSSLNARMERCVRQASRSTGKKVQLNLSGTETLVDSETLNQLVNPLIHVLRNAVDHGIDSTAERLQANKPADGQIDLHFGSDGKTITVTCDDDGGGINYEAIREKMIRDGVIDEADTPDNNSLIDYLLLPGVTTKTEATQLSGRGFGMDIVSEAVRAMNGKLEMTENDNGGCRVQIQLPVKLVTTHALLVEVSGQQYSIPSPFIEQIISLSMGNLEKVGRKETFFYANRAFPVVYLSERLHLPKAPPKKGQNPSVLVVNSGSDNIAVVVDNVVGNHEVVVKSLGRYLAGTFEQVSGVATLGDGQLIAVLNIASLLFQSQTALPPAATVADPSVVREVTPQQPSRSVLIVEDSLSVRNALSDIVEDAGYARVLAKDGLQALEILKSEPVGVVLTDLEMPRMDGLELTKQIRSSEEHGKLPVLMITSRTMEKHMTLADEAGVTEYITKPFSENQILDLVTKHFIQES